VAFNEDDIDRVCGLEPATSQLANSVKRWFVWVVMVRRQRTSHSHPCCGVGLVSVRRCDLRRIWHRCSSQWRVSLTLTDGMCTCHHAAAKAGPGKMVRSSASAPSVCTG
jgi:hypothetical protein